jgi:hypothetical protein
MANSKALATVASTSGAIDKFSAQFVQYLQDCGLPHENVLVVVDERRKVINLVPDLVALVAQERRAEAMYMSKFVAACGAGLFDAALNFIWDEVVLSLRRRVARFDLAYFYDTAVPPADREDYETETDLVSLSDSALIKGAHACGMLTDIGYKHIDYIRDMRNWASAAHPNQAQLTGYQLVAWFETCLKEVILREPEGAVLIVGRLLHNLRQHSITDGDVPAVADSIKRLPLPLLSALLRSIMGLYCDPRQDVRVRDNIKRIAKHVWSVSDDRSRGDSGLKYATYAANADVDRKALAHEFLELVDGLAYLPPSDLALNITQLAAQLETTHDAWDNFHHEPPLARQLRRYIPQNGDIPAQANDEYVRVLTRCRVGRRAGVASGAAPIYDALIDLFTETQIKAFVRTLYTQEIMGRLDNTGCSDRFRAIAARLRPKIVSQAIKRVFDAIDRATAAQLPLLSKDDVFDGLVAAM